MCPWRGLVRTHYFESTVSENSPTAMNSSKLASLADHISTDMFSMTPTSSRLVCQGQSFQVKWPVQVQSLTVSDNGTVAMLNRTLRQFAELWAWQKIVAKETACMEVVSRDYRIVLRTATLLLEPVIRMKQPIKTAQLSSVKYCNYLISFAQSFFFNQKTITHGWKGQSSLSNK